MKAGIITFHSAVNFGAALQACALRSAVAAMGHECSVIDYRPPAQREGSGIFRPIDSWRDAVKNGGALLFYGQMKLARSRFDSFAEEELELTSGYGSLEALRVCPPEADALICGSDQIWNTPGGPDPAYYLGFGSPSLRRVAYAPSFGDSRPTREQLEAARRWLPRFSAVSVREAGAASALAAAGIEAVPVLDPVLLHGPGYWSALSRPPERRGKYILCYPLYNPPRLNGLLRELRSRTGLPVTAVTTEPVCPVVHDRIVRDAGPREFLGLLLGAELVVTSSFHGTALAMLMSKPFFSVSRPGSRITDLLGRLGMEDRLYEGGVPDLASLRRIDWLGVLGRLGEEREASLRFLDRGLRS